MGDPQDLEQSLLHMLAGDEDAFRAIYAHVHPPLLRYLTVMVGGADAEDVASEAWAQAFRDLDRFEGDLDCFRGWVTTIGRHRALDHLRLAGRRPVVTGDLEEVLDVRDPLDVEAHTLGALGTDEAIALIASLPRDQAEAIMLRTVLGFDAPTAARILGKRPGAVRGAAHRGLRSLARRLEREDGPQKPSAQNSSGTP